MREKTFAMQGRAEKSVQALGPSEGEGSSLPGVITQQDIKWQTGNFQGAGGHTLPQTGNQGNSSKDKLQ